MAYKKEVLHQEQSSDTGGQTHASQSGGGLGEMMMVQGKRTLPAHQIFKGVDHMMSQLLLTVTQSHKYIILSLLTQINHLLCLAISPYADIYILNFILLIFIQFLC